MPKRQQVKGDFIKRRALMLPEQARYDYLLKFPTGTNLGEALVEAMNTTEADFEPLAGQLPKDYDRFDNKLLEDPLRNFDAETLHTASGDVFGRIYEYFLMKFAIQARKTRANSSRLPRWYRPSSASSNPTTAWYSTPSAAPATCSYSPATSSSTKG
jgi:hypothetical protein